MAMKRILSARFAGVCPSLEFLSHDAYFPMKSRRNNTKRASGSFLATKKLHVSPDRIYR